MNWQEACDNPLLGDLPFKIELDHFGRILMSPTSVEHGVFQSKISTLLEIKLGQQGGQVVTECAIETRLGVRVADVAWGTAAFFEKHEGEASLSQAPEICVEVRSPGNTEQEMEEKKQLYFEQGTTEFWLCRLDGHLDFFNCEGPLEASKIAPEFPEQVRTEKSPYFQELHNAIQQVQAAEQAKEVERQAKETERQAKEVERQAKEVERQAKEEAEAEVQRLQALLQKQNGQSQ